MPQFCAVFNCSSSSRRDKCRFFRFPSKLGPRGQANPLSFKRRYMWIKCLRRSDLTEKKLKNERICSKHFHSGEPSKLADVENVDWIPSLYLGHKKVFNWNEEWHLFITEDELSYVKKISSSELKNSEVTSSLSNCDNQENESELLVHPSQVDHDYHSPGRESALATNKVTKPDIVTRVNKASNLPGIKYKLEADDYEFALRRCHENIHRLKEEENKITFTAKSLESDPVKCKYYTSLDFESCKELYESILPYLKDHQDCRLTKFQQLILCLMRIKLKFDFTDLGFRFDCSPNVANVVFNHVFNVLISRGHLVDSSKEVTDFARAYIDKIGCL